MSSNPIEFKISLNEKDWDDRIGWNSDALNLPGVVIVEIFYDKHIASTSDWQQKRGAIHWIPSTHPTEIFVNLRLTTDFTELEKRKLELEAEKVQIEREKKDLEVEKVQLIKEKQASDESWKAKENRQKSINVLLTLISLLLAGVTTYVTVNKSSTPSPPVSQTTSPTSTLNSSDWLVCWHGKAVGPDKGGYEYMIAYPPNTFQSGLDLSARLAIEPGGKLDTLANDSLKMCYLKGKWYGGDKGSMPWFPHASYLKVEQDRILLYDDVSAQGASWTMRPVEPPSLATISLLDSPSDGKGIQVLKFRKTNSSGN
jgi:hypothetical protein